MYQRGAINANSNPQREENETLILGVKMQGYIFFHKRLKTFDSDGVTQN